MQVQKTCDVPHIHSSQVVESEFGVGSFSVDASELGWPPGFVPKTVNTNLGNGLPLVIERVTADKFVYRQDSGCVYVTVFND